jgi:hypothetical protein
MKATAAEDATMRRMAIVLAAGLGLAALSFWLTRGGIDSAHAAYENFEHGDYAEAVRAYQKSAATCHDLPALASNQAAALYRLDRYTDADSRYQLASTSEDALQSAKAQYDRGNCALRQASATQTVPDSALLSQAAEQFRACLSHETAVGGDERVFTDARHNLELTKLLQQPSSATEKTDVAARNESANDPQTGAQSDGSNASPTEMSERNRDGSPIESESRKPSSLLASLSSRPEGSDYLCPD